jgi:hypothetical protein
MVIDVIGSLFDQILSDPKVPPQMARQIARLQLPVLRAALGDPSFFSSRRTRCGASSTASPRWARPSRTSSDEQAAALPGQGARLVQEIVKGDFDQIEVYEQKLAALEAFVAEQARRGRDPAGRATALLAAQGRRAALQQLYAQRCRASCKAGGAGVPARLRQRGLEPGAAAAAERGRTANACNACASRPRAVHERAAQGLAGAAQGLPRRAAAPDAGPQRGHEPHRLARRPPRQFFGQLMPAHAEALKHHGRQPRSTTTCWRARSSRRLERRCPRGRPAAGRGGRRC